MPLALAESRPLVEVSTVDILRSNGMCAVAQLVALAAAVWPSANRAVYVPIYLAEPGVVVSLWIANGIHSGNVDIGLYNGDTLARIVSAGTTAMAGDNVLQVFDIADTPVTPGRYYLGVVCSTGSTATFMRSNLSLSLLRTMGVVVQSSALPLPDPMVPVAVLNGFYPLAGLSYRVTL